MHKKENKDKDKKEGLDKPHDFLFKNTFCNKDAIGAIFIALGRKTAYILDADIAGCFDSIDHNTLLGKLNTTPTFRKIIKGWLKAAIMEDKKFHTTNQGTAQSGTISPLLACVALHGLESHIKKTLTSDLSI